MRRIVVALLILSLLCFNVVFAADFLDDARDFSEGLAVAAIWQETYRFGYINKTGDWEIKPQFIFADDFSEGLAAVGIFTSPGVRKYGYIRKDGSYFIEPKFDYVLAFRNGFATVGINNGSGGYKLGIIDRNGNFAVPIKYEYVSNNGYYFDKGIIEISNDGKYGFVDLNNKIVVEPRFKSIIFDEFGIIKARVSEMVNGKEKWGIIFSDGRMVEPKYEGIGYFDGVKDELKGKILIFTLNGKVGLMDDREKYILEPKYDEFRYFQDGFTQVKLNNKYGYLKDDGTFLTDIKYDSATVFVRGIALVEENNKWGFLKTNGSYIGKPIYDQIFPFQGNTASVVLNGKQGILKRDGSYLFEPVYDHIWSNPDGTVKLIKDGKETIVNSDGSKAIKAEYDTIGEFENGVARITLKDKVGYLKIDGTYLVKPIYDSAFKDAGEDYYHIIKNNKWGLVFADGSVIEPVWEQALSFNNGYAMVRIDGKYTYLKKSGDLLTKEKFDYVQPFNDGMGKVIINFKTAYINEKGELSKIYLFGDDYSEGVAHVFTDEGHTFIDKNGNKAFNTNIRFGDAQSFSSNLAAVWVNGKWGYMNHKGEMEIQLAYDKAYPFYKDIAAVKVNNKYGFIDKKGKYIIEPKYDMISTFENGIANVWTGDTYGFINETGSYFTSTGSNRNLKFNEGIAAIGVINNETGGTKWGYIKQDGSWLAKPQFDFANYFQNGSGIVYLNGKTGTVGKNGTVTWK